MNHRAKPLACASLLLALQLACGAPAPTAVPTADSIEKPRVIVTSDGEIDDQCSMVRFLLYANEWDIEGIVSSSSQYHAHGHRWAGDDWIDPFMDAYEQVHPNLLKHDPEYPTPAFLRERTKLGNVESEGEMEEVTAGSELIVKVLLDATDERPVWLQAWGGTNTIARALKTIEEEHPERMAEVAGKLRFFFIWEQDATYQDYIRPQWGRYEIPTIISDQFEAIAYRWDQVQPEEMQPYFVGSWMKENILENHGPLTAIYEAHEDGAFARRVTRRPSRIPSRRACAVRSHQTGAAGAGVMSECVRIPGSIPCRLRGMNIPRVAGTDPRGGGAIACGRARRRLPSNAGSTSSRCGAGRMCCRTISRPARTGAWRSSAKPTIRQSSK